MTLITYPRPGDPNLQKSLTSSNLSGYGGERIIGGTLRSRCTSTSCTVRSEYSNTRARRYALPYHPDIAIVAFGEYKVHEVGRFVGFSSVPYCRGTVIILLGVTIKCTGNGVNTGLCNTRTLDHI